ncbi:unnamed protein product [Rotaria magnacalcarata]|uniref:Uncharacterized protein n=2 Tax=Rotaria magnacalcarata TaxID=392030 RepID=A0A820AA98_9BILA|nr:unnamed protein product [Rotaria magnacalcarata]CAF4212019.1 unnamed protein product [Rotaria magnacalcarata]
MLNLIKTKSKGNSRIFRKKINQTALRRKHRRDDEIFPRTIVCDIFVFLFIYIGLSYVEEYNGQNLLGIHDAGDYGRFVPKVMKILFSSTEMSQSIIYSNSMRCANGLSLEVDYCYCN